MEKKVLRRFDLVTSILLIIFSIFMMFESYKLFPNPFGKSAEMLKPEEIATNWSLWYQSPGFLPLVVSIILIILSIGLLIIAIKDGARLDFFNMSKLTNILKDNKEIRTCIVVLGLIGIYIYVLMPVCREYLDLFHAFQGFPFAIATTIYITTTAIIYQPKLTKKSIAISFAVGLVSAFTIALLFNKLALIMLP